jgi:superfamily I DNA/RNA helicase/RecB family exonuclease
MATPAFTAASDAITGAATTVEPFVPDPSQRAVIVLADDASAAVIGAPGSGKTSTLVDLVADRVLVRGWSPQSVLVLSANRTSATRLRDAIAERLAVPTLGPLARTANSVAFQVLRDAAVRSGDEAPRLLTGAEQDMIIAELVEGQLADGTGDSWPPLLDIDLRRLAGFRSELRDLLMRVEEYGVTAERLRQLGIEHDRPEWAAAAAFMTTYRRVLAFYRGNNLDSSELVAHAAGVVERGDDLGALAEVRLLVLDDAQELTESVLSFVRALVSRGVSVIAFGDPDVAVGSFRGARPEILGTLGAALGIPGLTTLQLSSVHRHGAAIRSLVSRITGRIGASAAGVQRGSPSLSPVEGAVEALTVGSSAAEVSLIARRLREAHIFDGVPWSRLAVVLRSGGQVPGLARGLAALEVPTQQAGPGGALRDEGVVAAIVRVLEVALGRIELDPVTAVTVMLEPFGGLDPVTLRRLRVALRHEELAGDGARSTDELLVDALQHPARLASIDTRVARQAAHLAETIRAAREEADGGATIEELLWGIWSRSKLDTLWYEQSLGSGIVADEANHNLDAMVALFSTAKRFVERTPDNPPGVFLDAWAGADVAEDTLAPRALGAAVSIGTPASMLGREFHTVIVAGVQEAVWPNPRIRGSLLGAQAFVDLVRGGEVTLEGERAAVMNDELRLFASAVSRATERVLVTAVASEDTLPSPFMRFIVGSTEIPVAETKYPLSLRGLVGRLRRVAVDTTSSEERATATAALAKLARNDVPGADPASWYGVAPWSTEAPLVDLEQPDARVRVSPSRLEAFEMCGLHWLIGELGGTTSSTASNLGTIVHSVAEQVGLEADPDISTDALWSGIEARWGELSFDSTWESDMEKRRARVIAGRLSSYLNDFAAAGGRLLSTEVGFELEVGQAVLAGKIDRVELLSDGTAIIVDLKTGAREPISDAGVVDNAQLGAYQLAFESGSLESIPEGVRNGGAKLVVLSSGTQKKNYRNPTQAAFTDVTMAEFSDRVMHDAEGMAGSVFVAQLDTHCLDGHAYGNCGIHVVRAVSA